MVYEIDQSVGRLVKALEDQSMLEDTIIVFSSDNGAAPDGLNGNAGSNWPLRGAKNTTWEGAVRVTGLVWSPLLPEERRGQVISGLVDMTDWLPTLYQSAGYTFCVHYKNFIHLKNKRKKCRWRCVASGIHGWHQSVGVSVERIQS